MRGFEKEAVLSITKLWIWLVILCSVAGFNRVAPAADGNDWKILVHPTNSFFLNVLSNNKSVLQIGAGGWGPGWSPWIGINSDAKARGDQFSISAPMEIGGQRPIISLDVKSGTPHSAIFDYTIHSSKAVPILQIIASVGLPSGTKGKAIMTKVDGSDQAVDLPMHPAEIGLVKKITLTGPAWTGAVEIALDPPLEVNGDRDLRIKLAAGTIKPGITRARLTLSFPANPSLLLKESDVIKFAPPLATSDWFAYQPTGDVGRSRDRHRGLAGQARRQTWRRPYGWRPLHLRGRRADPVLGHEPVVRGQCSAKSGSRFHRGTLCQIRRQCRPHAQIHGRRLGRHRR